MTQSQMWDAFAVIDSLGCDIRHIANLDQGTVTIECRSARTGHIVVRVLASVPTAADARAMIREMERELRARGRRTRKIIRAERVLDAE